MIDGSELTKLDYANNFASYAVDLGSEAICGCNEIRWMMKMPFKKMNSLCKNGLN